MIDTWHCVFSDPRDALGITPITAVAFQYAQQDCSVTSTTTQDASIIGSASTSPLYTQDSGNLTFALTIIITLLFLVVVAFLYNSFTNKKTWRS